MKYKEIEVKIPSELNLPKTAECPVCYAQTNYPDYKCKVCYSQTVFILDENMEIPDMPIKGQIKDNK